MFKNDHYEVEPTHAVFDRFGYCPNTTPVDKLMDNPSMGLCMFSAMENEDGGD